MRRRISKIFIALTLALFCFVSAASAELLYTRQDQSYSNTALGVILDGHATSPLVSNMGGNAGQSIAQFINKDGETRVAISLYTYGGASDVINIYSPAPDADWGDASAWSSPLEATTSLINTRKIVSSGDYLYGISYDNYTVSKISFADDNYSEAGTYVYQTNSENDTAHGEGLVAYNGKLYAIFSVSQGNVWTTGTYSPNRLVRFDENLNAERIVEMKGKNLDGFAEGAYTLSGNTLYVVTLGGVQQFGENWNPESSVEIVNLDRMEITQPITAEAMNAKDDSFKHMFSAVAVVGDKVYVQATRWSSGAYESGYSIRVYETTKSALAAGDLGSMIREFTGTDGWKSSMTYDAETGLLWCGVGYDLWSYDGTAWQQYDMNALGGIISSFAAVMKDTRWSNYADTSWYDGEGAAAGTEDDPYVITTAEQLAGLASLVYNCQTTFSNSYFVMGADIDLQNREWLPIGWFMRNSSNYGFAGIFDGRGRSITGLFVSDISNTSTDIYNYTSECPALFGYLTPDGRISNLYVRGVVKGNEAQGAAVLVTWNTGTVTNCVVYGEEIIAEGAGRGYAGGIAAVDNSGTISNCVSYGRYTAQGTSFNYAAGFVGYASQAGITTFTNCVGLAEKAQAGIAQGMIGADTENCYYLTGGAETPEGPGMGGGDIGNYAPLTATAITDESEAPVSAVLFDSESNRNAGVVGKDHTVRLAAYPQTSPTTDMVCEWSFDDADVTVVSTDGISATINSQTAGEKYFTVTVTGINGIDAGDTANALVLRGKVQIEDSSSFTEETPDDSPSGEPGTEPDDSEQGGESVSSSGSSGGCNSGFGGIALLLTLAFVPVITRRVRK